MEPEVTEVSKIEEIIETIYEICKQGQGFDCLKTLFHKDVVMVPPQFTSRAKGRDICLKSYEDACSQMNFEQLHASDRQIEVITDQGLKDQIWQDG